MATSVIKRDIPFVGKRYLTANEDLNDFIGSSYTGIYYISGSGYTPINTPTINTGAIATYSILIVMSAPGSSSSTLTHQYCIRMMSAVHSQLYMRAFTGSPASWSEWKLLTVERPGLIQSFKYVDTLDNLLSVTNLSEGNGIMYPVILSLKDTLTKTLIGGDYQVSSTGIFKTSDSRIDYTIFPGSGLPPYNGYISLPSKAITVYKTTQFFSSTSLANQLYGISGFITSGATLLLLNAPLKINPKWTKLTVSQMTITLRHSSGGYVGSSGMDVTSLINNVTVYPKQCLIRFSIIKSGGWGITNNTPICGDVYVKGTFS